MKHKNLYISLVCVCLAVVLTLGFVYAQSESTAPIAENLEICTYREVSVGGQLKAVDPDGDVLTFEITTTPTKGSIELEEDSGCFVYSPAAGKRGRDYFGYKAVDSNGNYSSEATVIIKIEKQKTKVTYSDMSGNSAHYATIVLAEKDIFVGECLGGMYVFNPDTPVTRGEFLTMCLKLNNFNILSGVITTGFVDDDDIPAYQKPYVSTALLTGIVAGYSYDTDTAVFMSNNGIRYSEAAVMLNKSMNLTNVNTESYGDTAPEWAAQSCANLSACKIASYDQTASEDILTRGECAKILCEAIRVLDNR